MHVQELELGHVLFSRLQVPCLLCLLVAVGSAILIVPILNDETKSRGSQEIISPSAGIPSEGKMGVSVFGRLVGGCTMPLQVFGAASSRH